VLIRAILESGGVRTHSINSRPKDRPSFARKVAAEDGRYRRLRDVTDICGARVTTYFADDVDRVADVIAREFKIDWPNSVDKRAAMEPTQFGYLSLHYVVALKPSRARLAEYKDFAKLKAEVQIRSILQHGWAEIEHDLGYKTELGVPREIRRRFSRLAGLLEIADSEFVGIRDALRQYESQLPARIADTSQDVPLDKASLLAFFASDPLPYSVARRIASANGTIAGPLDPEQFEGEVRPLTLLGIETVGALRRALRENEDRIVSFSQVWLKDWMVRSFAGTAALLYLAYVLIGTSKDAELADKYIAEKRLGPGEPAEVTKEIFEAYDASVATARKPRGKRKTSDEGRNKPRAGQKGR
jgi:ppGpp synthetase/RelA/SpoT-type nucleotidyltranferase